MAVHAIAEPIRVVVANPRPTIWDGVFGCLERNRCIELVGTARDGVAALRLVGKFRPDALFLNAPLTDLSVTEVIEHMGAVCQMTQVVVLLTSAASEGISRCHLRENDLFRGQTQARRSPQERGPVASGRPAGETLAPDDEVEPVLLTIREQEVLRLV